MATPLALSSAPGEVAVAVLAQVVEVGAEQDPLVLQLGIAAGQDGGDVAADEAVAAWCPSASSQGMC